MRQIKIGGVTYNILLKDHLEDEEGRVIWGQTDFKKATIEILSVLSDQKRNQTIVHEVTHAMLHEAGLDEETMNEDLVTPLGNMLYQVLLDNMPPLNSFKESKSATRGMEAAKLETARLASILTREWHGDFKASPNYPSASTLLKQTRKFQKTGKKGIIS